MEANVPEDWVHIFDSTGHHQWRVHFYGNYSAAGHVDGEVTLDPQGQWGWQVLLWPIGNRFAGDARNLAHAQHCARMYAMFCRAEWVRSLGGEGLSC